MSRPVVTRADPHDRERVLDTVVAAFRADPAFRFFFPDDARYPEQAAAFAGHLFDRRVGGGTVWIVEGGAAVAMWDAPGAPPGDAADLPAAAAARLVDFDAAVHALLPATAHWYLGVLATHPDHAGRRWGRAVMAAGLDAAAAGGLPAYLETANAGNVELYRRAGWAVTGTATVHNVPLWVMRWLPPAGRTDAGARAPGSGPTAGDSGPTAGDSGPTAGDSGPKAGDPEPAR